MTPIILLDYLGIALFAATGALAASRRELDLIGFMFLASVTGIGGGTVRDLVLDVPVFWVEHPIHILVCAGTAALVYITAHLVEYRYRLLLWLDAIALAAYSVFGAYKGLMVTGSPVLAIVMGMLTGTMGGIMRDVLANEPSVLLRKEIYVTAAMAGAVAFVLARMMELPVGIPALLGFVSALGIRSSALVFGWTLPTYRSRPGRHIP